MPTESQAPVAVKDTRSTKSGLSESLAVHHEKPSRPVAVRVLFTVSRAAST